MKIYHFTNQSESLLAKPRVLTTGIVLLGVLTVGLLISYAWLVVSIAGKQYHVRALSSELTDLQANVAKNQTLLLNPGQSEASTLFVDVGSNLTYLYPNQTVAEASVSGSTQ